jgi:hypothetical protein
MIIAGPANDRALWRRDQALIAGRRFASAAAVNRNTGFIQPIKGKRNVQGSAWQQGSKEAQKGHLADHTAISRHRQFANASRGC